MRPLMMLLVAATTSRAAIPQPVKVAGGLVTGVSGKDSSVTVFKGIPFAAPPVGDLRWKAPQPVRPWQGVRKADQFGNSCMQNIVDEHKPWTYEFMTHTGVSEDCLFLNVWTGAQSAGERRPVYVYIYGGGNTEGSGAVPVYDGEGLAKKGIVVVTVNYRLGILGFFTHPELTAESGVHASGNYALLDLIAALHWVHDNIAAFGGDPGRVVIGGQSAGASNVHSLVASPLAKGLFHGAIAESGSSVGGLGLMGARTLADQEKAGVQFAEAKGAHSLAELRNLSWKELTAPVPGAGPFRFGVVVDGYVQPAPAAEMFAQGRQNDVPTLTGCNQGEGGASPHPTVTAEAFQKAARQRYTDLGEDFLALYPAATDEQAHGAQNESSWDSTRASMYLWAVNRARTAKTKAYTYFWEHTMPGPDADRFGAFHTSEVPYVMNTLYMSDRPFADADHKIADMMSSYWVNFVRTGDPNGKGLAHWPAVSEQPGATMELGDRALPIPVAGSPAKLAFFEKYFSKPQTPRPPM
ncbi:MAG TPA: carboxylesterase family protein [Verrucomicrobiae bacterium]|nr:carboxylesterase family protein [Verrucomicrobiae bacterium]